MQLSGWSLSARDHAQGAGCSADVNFIMLKLGYQRRGGRGKLIGGTVRQCVPLAGLLGGWARNDPERCERLELVEVAALGRDLPLPDRTISTDSQRTCFPITANSPNGVTQVPL